MGDYRVVSRFSDVGAVRTTYHTLLKLKGAVSTWESAIGGMLIFCDCSIVERSSHKL